MCREMFYISYKMLLRHLPKWLDGVLNDSVGEVRLPHPPPGPFCRIMPKYENKSEDPSPLSLLTVHVFAQLSQLVAVFQACVAPT
jgi:hypothetical protein